MKKRTYSIPDINAAYRAMATDHEREADAREWSEAMIADGSAQEDMGDSDDINPSFRHDSKSS